MPLTLDGRGGGAEPTRRLGDDGTDASGIGADPPPPPYPGAPQAPPVVAHARPMAAQGYPGAAAPPARAAPTANAAGIIAQGGPSPEGDRRAAFAALGPLVSAVMPSASASR